MTIHELMQLTAPMPKKLTIQEIKERTKDTAPYFFSPDTLRFFGQTLRSFSVSHIPEGRHKGKYLISAPFYDFRGVYMGRTERVFDPVKNTLNPAK